MPTALDRWMAAYRRAWDSNAPDDIAALFAAGAEYRFAPWTPVARGVDEIVARWLAGADEPDDHEFSWHVIGVDGARHFVQGRTVYTDGRTYENLWIIDLDPSGRATSFIEWYMESASKPLGPNA